MDELCFTSDTVPGTMQDNIVVRRWEIKCISDSGGVFKTEPTQPRQGSLLVGVQKDPCLNLIHFWTLCICKKIKDRFTIKTRSDSLRVTCILFFRILWVCCWPSGLVTAHCQNTKDKYFLTFSGKKLNFYLAINRYLNFFKMLSKTE